MKIGSNNHNMIGIPGWCPYRNGFCKEASVWKAEIIDEVVVSWIGAWSIRCTRPIIDEHDWISKQVTIL